MRKAIAVILVGALTLGMVGTATAARDEPPRQPSEESVEAVTPPQLEAIMARIERLAERAERARVKCTTLKCINRTLTRHDNAIANLYGFLDSFLGCLALVPVNQYEGYLWTPDMVNTYVTTALDYPYEGEPMNNLALYWDSEACPLG